MTRRSRVSEAVEGLTPEEAMSAGIEEADRLARGEFDGLLGSLDPGSSRLLRDIIAQLRDVLLDQYTDEEARELIAAFEPRPGYRNLPVVPDDVDLALRLMNLVASALRCNPDRRDDFFLGPRDASRQRTVKKPRRPRVDDWIDRQLQRRPDVKAPELYALAPDWLTSDVGLGRFRRRLTAGRKRLKSRR